MIYVGIAGGFLLLGLVAGMLAVALGSTAKMGEQSPPPPPVCRCGHHPWNHVMMRAEHDLGACEHEECECFDYRPVTIW